MAASCTSSIGNQELAPKSVDNRRDSVLQPVKHDIYAPLADCTKEIRICTIAPETEGAELSINLRNAALDESFDQYFCLSYVWGDENMKLPVSVNGRQHRVPQNLHSLLHRLRHFGLGANLWIDAICIDQGDNAEKAEQVKLMGRIYSRAKGVIIGLEERAPYVEELAGSYALVKAAIEQMANNSHLCSPECFVFAGSKQIDETACGLFQRLLDSPWFTRTWTVQELCLAREATVLLSWGTLPWATFVGAFTNWDKHRLGCCLSFAESLPEEVKAACYSVSLSIFARKDDTDPARVHVQVHYHVQNLIDATTNLAHQQHLLRLIFLFQHLAVSNPRDKVYAFRGLHTAAGNLPAPDYSKSVESVFTELSLWLLDDLRSLIVLALDLPGGPNLPTWTPDFGVKPPCAPIYWRNKIACYVTYDCAPGLDWFAEEHSPGKLLVRGVEIDRIQKVTENPLTLQASADHMHLLRGWSTFANEEQGSSGPDQPLDDAFCATMIAGCAKDDAGFRTAEVEDLASWKAILTRMMQGDALDDDDATARSRECHITAVLGRRLFRTSAGRLGIASGSLRSGDSVWILGGGNAPFIVRRSDIDHSGKQEHVLISHAYVHGIMHGKAIYQATDIQDCLLV